MSCSDAFMESMAMHDMIGDARMLRAVDDAVEYGTDVAAGRDGAGRRGGSAGRGRCGNPWAPPISVDTLLLAAQRIDRAEPDRLMCLSVPVVDTLEPKDLHSSIGISVSPDACPSRGYG